MICGTRRSARSDDAITNQHADTLGSSRELHAWFMECSKGKNIRVKNITVRLSGHRDVGGYRHTGPGDGVTITVNLIVPIAMDKGLRFAVVPRNILKSFFERGDKPTQEQFGSLIDSMASRAFGQGHELKGHVTLIK